MHQIHHRNQGKQKGGRRVGGLAAHPGNKQQQFGNSHHAEKTVHHPLVQPVTHPDQQHQKHHHKSNVSRHKDSGSLKSNLPVDNMHGASGINAGHIRRGEKDQHGRRQKNIGLPCLCGQVGNLAGIRAVMVQKAEQQHVVNASQAVHQGSGRVRMDGDDMVQNQIRAGGHDQHAQHRDKNPEALHPYLEGDEQEHQHDKANPQHGNLAGEVILFNLHRSRHS